MHFFQVRAAFLFGAICFAATAAPFATCRAADDESKTVSGAITAAFDAATSQITLDLTAPLGAHALKVAGFADKAALAKTRSNDILKVEVDDPNNPQSITKIVEIDRPVGKTPRLIALAISFGILLLIAAGVTGWKPYNFLIGTDNRYSNSKCQLALWFGVVTTVYMATVGLRIWLLGWDFIGGVGLTQNLVVLTGLSAFTFGGAKAITVKKVNDAANAGKEPVKRPAAKANFPADLVQNDGLQGQPPQMDIGDLQMILVTLAAVIIFLLSAFHFLENLQFAQTVTLPDVDTTLLSGFGLGQGAYLIKKAASNPGDG